MGGILLKNSTNQKTFVIDTSVLLYDIDALDKFGANTVIIPSIVYEEINKFKEESSERGYYARHISKLFDELSKEKPLKEGVLHGETLIKTSYEISHEDIDGKLTMNQNDYKIIACAIKHNAILITRDRMMRVIGRDFVEVEEYMADKVDVKELFKGYRRVEVDPIHIEKMFTNELKNDEFGLYPNEFIIMVDKENPQHTGIGICKKGKIIPCDFNNMFKTLSPKLRPVNLEQKMLMYLLLDEDILAVTCTGVSGKGKTILPVDFALSAVAKGDYNQFLYTKSVISVDKREELGFYKGDVNEKLKPHLQPLYNSIEYLYKDEMYKGNERSSVDVKVEQLMEKDILSFYPLANIRGMSLFDKVVMLDEAQNVTNHMIKSLVTRVTDTSKLIVTGDIEQIDDKNLNKYNNGLVHLIESGKHQSFIGHITMDISKGSKRGKLADFGANNL